MAEGKEDRHVGNAEGRAEWLELAMFLLIGLIIDFTRVSALLGIKQHFAVLLCVLLMPIVVLQKWFRRAAGQAFSRPSGVGSDHAVVVLALGSLVLVFALFAMHIWLSDALVMWLIGGLLVAAGVFCLFCRVTGALDELGRNIAEEAAARSLAALTCFCFAWMSFQIPLNLPPATPADVMALILICGAVSRFSVRRKYR